VALPVSRLRESIHPRLYSRGFLQRCGGKIKENSAFRGFYKTRKALLLLNAFDIISAGGW
jgi:hypothetical protein